MLGIRRLVSLFLSRSMLGEHETNSPVSARLRKTYTLWSHEYNPQTVDNLNRSHDQRYAVLDLRLPWYLHIPGRAPHSRQ